MAADKRDQSPRVDSQRKTKRGGRRNPPGGRPPGATDRIPRGSVRILFKTVLEDDGTLERDLRGETSFRARAARMMLRNVEDPKFGMAIIEKIGDRLEGKLVQVTEERNPPEIYIDLGPDDDDATPGSSRPTGSGR